MICAAAVVLQAAYAGVLAQGYRAFDREAQFDSLSHVLRAASRARGSSPSFPSRAAT